MADRTIKHFVIVRFFEHKVKGYVHDIFDVNFVAGRVLLAKNNLLKSLENQTNKNFEIIFLVNDRYLSEEKYKFIFTELQDGMTVPVKFMKSVELRQRITDAYDDYDFVIQSRIDYDDFAYKDAVADTQAKVEKCNNIFSYGYGKGYAYFNGNLYPVLRPSYQLSPFVSFILKSSFAKNFPYIGVTGFNHAKIRESLKIFLEKNGLEFSADMYQNNLSANAFIFFRHDATSTNKGKAYTEPPSFIKKLKALTDKDITKKQLEEEFGFFYDLDSIK